MKCFALSFLSVLLMTGMSYSTIIVTNQDTTIGVGQSFDLGLNGDSQTDYIFSVHMLSTGYVVYIEAMTDLNVAAKHMHMPDHHDAVLKFAFGDSLGLEWMSEQDSLTMYNSENSTGQWSGETNMYIGFKFVSGSNEHWGWLKASVAADASTVTLKEYGFEDSLISSGSFCPCLSDTYLECEYALSKSFCVGSGFNCILLHLLQSS